MTTAARNDMKGEKQSAEQKFERFRRFTKKLVAIPKAEIDRRAKKHKKSRNARRKRAAAA